MRKAIIALISLAIIGSIGYFLIPVNPIGTTTNYSSAINAIPSNAAFIIRSNAPNKKWNELQQTKLGRAVSGFESIKGLSTFFSKIDSLAGKNPHIENIISSTKTFISGHISGVNTTQFLFTTANNEIQAEPLIKLIQQLLTGSKISTKTYEEVVISSFNQKGSTICFANVGNVIILTNSSILAEQSIRQLKNNHSLLNNQDFKKLLKTADDGLDANLFVNFNEFSKSLSKFTNKSISPVKHLSKFGTWSEVDLNIKDNGILLNGFSMINDSIQNYLNTFKNEESQSLMASSILPENTGMLLYLSFTDFNSYYKKFEKHLAQKQILYKHQKNILNINKKHSFTVEGDFFSWIGNEVCLYSTEGDNKDAKDKFGLAIRTNNIQKAKEGLKSIHNSTGNTSVSEYQNFKIKNLGLTNYFDLTLGQQFKTVTNSYYVILEDYVVFSNTESNLKHIINSYLRGKTLVKNIQFNQFYNQFNNQSNFFFYNNFKKGSHLWKSFLNEETFKSIEEQTDSLNQLGAFGLQINSQKNMYYTNMYLNYNSNEETPTLSLIETKLDTSYSLKPWVLVNHYTKEKEILIQDNDNKLYLINNVGKVLWKKQLKETILGDVVQVDRYKNDKLQYAFGTKNFIHQIDRNGKNVGAYPIKLKAPMTKGVTVLDYDKNKNYRVLITQGKNINNFDIAGKQIKGWSFKSTSSPISTQPQLLQVGNKDYIVTSDHQGKVRILNRKGEDRIQLNVSLPNNANNFHIWKNNALSNSGVIATDSVGTIHFVKLSDELETFTLKSFSKDHEIYFNDFNGDQVLDFITFDERSITAYKANKQIITKIEDIEFKPAFGIQCFNYGKDKSMIFITNKYENKCFAYNQKGELLESFPIEGVTPVCINDLNNDGNKKLIIGDKLGSVYIYSIVD